MSDKFLGYGSSTDITNGTALVYAASLGASSLDPSQPVKTNATRQLVSTKLDISDVNNLQASLNNTISNPFAGELTAQSYVATLGNPNKRIRVTEDTISSDNGTVMNFATTGTIDVQTSKISGIATPTSDTDASTKGYVDSKFSTAMGSAMIQPVAPAGQRDLFVPSTGTSGVVISGDTALRDILYNAGNTLAVAKYSVDGGVTFNPCVFDVTPVSFVKVGANAVVSVALTETQAYRSVDGINFVLQATPPTGDISANILWSARLGLFIVRTTVSPTENIMTSPDGVTWTARTSPNIATYTIAESNNRIVAVGTASPFAMWSDDGITWTTTLSTLSAQCRGLSYSPEQALWITIAITGVIYQSTDGKTWTPTGFTTTAVNGNVLRWVGGTVSRWYIAAYSAAGNHSMWSTADPRVANFVGCELDGALPTGNGLQYGLLYDKLRGRFLIGYNASPFVSVGTPRPNDIKALSDNIRVRNSPVAVGLYSGYTDIVVANSNTETSITPSIGAIGSMFLQAPQPLGMSIETSFTVLASSVRGDTLTFRLKTAGTTLLSIQVTVPAAASNLVIRGVFSTVIRATTAASSGHIQVGTVSVVGASTAVGYTRTAGNTLNVTAQWGAAASTLTMSQIKLDSTFRNGA